MFLTLIVLFILVYLIVVALEEWGPRPFNLTFIYILLLMINWVLFLTDFYALFPGDLGSRMWDVVWSGLCLSGILIAFNEFRNNKAFALIIVCIAGLHFNFFLFSLFLDRM